MPSAKAASKAAVNDSIAFVDDVPSKLPEQLEPAPERKQTPKDDAIQQEATIKKNQEITKEFKPFI